MGVILVADAVYIASLALRSEHTVMTKCPAIVSASSSCDLLLVFNSSLTVYSLASWQYTEWVAQDRWWSKVKYVTGPRSAVLVKTSSLVHK